MRISDWSSDVCSSDLFDHDVEFETLGGVHRVRVDTMHSTKGLEFDIVIVSAWEEGNFPRKVYSDAALEEDRRLAYVTFTRARDMFVATVARQRPNGRRQPSRFLNDIGLRSEEHTSELQSLMRSQYAVFCFKKKIYFYNI